VKNITTGISNIQTVPALSVYPNPATDHIQVKADFSGETSVELFIHNSTGQLIYHSRINEVSGAINQSVDLPKGMAKGNYILSLIGKKQKQTARFIIQ